MLRSSEPLALFSSFDLKRESFYVRYSAGKNQQKSNIHSRIAVKKKRKVINYGIGA